MENRLPEIMTIEEVAEYLRVPLSSLYKLAQHGKIPASKVGRHWRFRREFINRWMDEQVQLMSVKSQNLSDGERS
jgi:excisionase family DNA binding protein